ncbi:RICIN domain-containing protein [Streptomyces sp900105755]|uniref:RICIN domain-containing protein n=1 Tax=Streptomyces sp. 900105755 TaxID=3154389 RepID=UPI0033277BE1
MGLHRTLPRHLQLRETAVAAGRALDVRGGQAANGSAVQVRDSNGGAHQRWYLG